MSETPNKSFRKASEFGGGGVFKPGDYMTAFGLLVEPKSLLKDQRNEYNGNVTIRDEVVSDISVFKTEESLTKGKPDAVLKGTKIVHGMLTGTAKNLIGEQGAFVVAKTKTQRGEGYVFRDASDDVTNKIVDYWEKREAAVADAQSGGAPSFE